MPPKPMLRTKAEKQAWRADQNHGSKKKTPSEHKNKANRNLLAQSNKPTCC